MRDDNWYADIDGRDSNGNYVCGINSDDTRHSDIDSASYVHIPPTKEHIRYARILGLEYKITQMREQLIRFQKYSDDALKEHQKWQRNIASMEEEIAQHAL